MDLSSKFLNPSRRLKEEFVSNLTGSSMLEIAALSVIVPALVILRKWCSLSSKRGLASTINIVGKTHGRASSKFKGLNDFTIQLMKDFVIIILPTILVFTVLAEWAYIWAIILIFVLLFVTSAKRSCTPTLSTDSGPAHLSSYRESILSYRVILVVMTSICILAVDFKIFPRRYAKTETYGTSCMDLGVGSFVVANSLVSKQARQVHVGEYGAHWNFFFTLAAVSLLTSIISIHPKYCAIFGSVILIAYQMCLKLWLSDYLLSEERGLDIFSQNKEGFFSIFGYWGMYLIGVYLGYTIFFVNGSANNTESEQHKRSRIWILCIIFWSMTIILDRYLERVSRRMCNLAYVTLVLAQNLQILLVLSFSDFIPEQTPLLLEEVFNQNLLGSFLLANVLTGMVNLSVDTLSASSFAALSILVGYVLLLMAAASFAWFRGIKLKFW
ncbi:hypothetical protein KSP40_PGU008777 [Platanthera guangdongensis]|uniref:Uncharacterized protein n=1 Tax=Platanthera guangdongensis TaxID=2320717 RepID=A0ABR2MWA6_9ASPA